MTGFSRRAERAPHKARDAALTNTLTRRHNHIQSGYPTSLNYRQVEARPDPTRGGVR